MNDPPALAAVRSEQGASGSLRSTHAKSILVNAGTTGLVAVQNLAVLFVLDRAELGLLGIASGVAAVALIAQYFGVGASTLKEVAVAPDEASAFKAMVTGLALRLALSIPVSAVLILGAGVIADSVYGYPELRTPLVLSGVTIALYGISDVLGYTLQGRHRWAPFFVAKLGGAASQCLAVVALTVLWGVDGYFTGLVVGALLLIAAYAVPVVGAFSSVARLPTRRELRAQVRGMARLSIAAHLAKVGQTLLLQAPILIAGYYYAVATTGDVKFAITVAGLVLGLAGAVNAINVAVFSREHARDESDFTARAAHEVTVYCALFGVLAMVVALVLPEVVGVVGDGRFEAAQDLAVWVVCAAALQGLLGVIVSTIYIPVGAHVRFVAVYLVPALLSTAGCLVSAGSGGDIEAMGIVLFLSSALGVALAMIDLARRSIVATLPAVILPAGLAAALLSLGGESPTLRYGLLALLVGIGAIGVAWRRAT